MSINEFYQVFVGYALWAAGGVVVLLLLNRYRKIAESGNVRKMAIETAAPGIMLIVAILISGVAVAFALPRINAFFASEQIVAAVQAGDIATKQLDVWFDAPPVSSNAGGGFNGFQSAQFSGGSNGMGTGLLGGAPSFGSAQIAPSSAAVEVPAVVPTVQPTPISPLIQQASGGHDRYTVQRGDSMYAIAQKLLGNGNRYPELCGANVQRVGSNCNLLKAGMTIIVPSDIQAYTPPQLQRASVPVAQPTRSIQQASVRSSVPVAQAASGGKSYTIAAGDNMYKIAGKNGGIGKLYDICRANISVLGGNCDQITVGATIVIP
jgi:nucleoid-associated protein YgaU